MKEAVGVIGGGQFGSTIVHLLSQNAPVLLYTRQGESWLDTAARLPFKYPVKVTEHPEELCAKCRLIFPVVSSESFREVIKLFADFLQPYHIIIHGTKGFDLQDIDLRGNYPRVKRDNIHTMSQVLVQETRVVRVGCLSGPNISAEILAGRPAASVIASAFDEVITLGHQALNSDAFKVYGSHDLLGTELAGGLKNMIAIGTGIIAGRSLGKNIEALLITRGLREMLLIGQVFGASIKTFFGTAGLGDLIVTSTSADSRNYQFGYRLGQGAQVQELVSSTGVLVEGIRTIKLMYHLCQTYQLDTPIVEILHGLIFRNLPQNLATSYLLDYPYSVDVDYID